ncbi:hypothetical protein [Sphaerisporangium corydalis]|uniref:Uncharacterized protein n=1 Tax=Sphaerisporangium corydalis TaxID=1441875 RepID=A0ABV9E9X2_9ACTN|nr:hypothetical protein [Sphaerisporangium corydalis]
MTDSSSEIVGALDALARALDPKRFSALVVRGYALPFLRVVSLEAPSLAERITVRLDEAGAPSFWWSWNERMAPVQDVSHAAEHLSRVLSPATTSAKPVNPEKTETADHT